MYLSEAAVVMCCVWLCKPHISGY